MRSRLLKRKWLVLTVLFLLIISVVLVFNRQINGQHTKIETAKAQVRDVTETITSSGKTKAIKQVDLHFQTYGRLAWVGVAEGDYVQAYQAIANLDKQEIEKNFQKALRDYSKERNDFEEDKRDTYKNTPVTDTIKRILEKNQWDLEKAVMDVEIKDIALKWATLTTPISGKVIKVDTPVAGVNVTATDTFTIADPNSIVFNANIDETDMGKISVGQIANVDLDAYPDKSFSGQVDKIAFAAEISAGGATVYPVDIKFVNAPSLLVGLNGDVSLIVQKAEQVLTIPADAVKEDDNKYVIRKADSGYEKVLVKTGIEDDTYVQITDGLSQEDEIVIKGFEYLPKDLLK